MSAPLPDAALPYGVRDLKLTKYTDGGGTLLGSTSVDLPNMQTLTFNETEEFTELRGDDRVITTRGQGAQVEFEIEAGGISVAAWAILTGGTVIETGLTPNRRRMLRKFATSSRPFFRIHGQIIGDNVGDVQVFIYRCRVTESVEGEFADGEFFVTSCSGAGLPLLETDFDLLYDIVINETAVPIPTTPLYNPLAPPRNLAAGAITATTAPLTWTAVTGATSYQVYESLDDGVTFTAVGSGRGGTPSAATTTITTLTTATDYQYKVTAKNGAVESGDSNILLLTTL